MESEGKEQAQRLICFSGNSRVLCIDSPDENAAGACHEYLILGPDDEVLGAISFQKGPVLETGLNGVQNDALMAILIDRMKYFQNGPFASFQNAITLNNLEAALSSDDARTSRRVRAGVEGKNEVVQSLEDVA